MVKQFVYTLLLLLPFNASSQVLTEDEKSHITAFIDAVKKKDFIKLMPYISFPLDRTHPIPDIQNEREFIYRFDELFDDSLTQLLVNSNIENDWSKIGWRGIMFNNGDIWIDDYNWNVRRINFQSKIEQERMNTLIEYDKLTVHESLSQFELPIMVLKTSKHLIRIDLTENEFYRYSVWPLNKEMSEKPDLILDNGKLEYMGSGGNHQYEFKNGDYMYFIQINILGTEETPPANLMIEKNGAEILFTPAEIVND